MIHQVALPDLTRKRLTDVVILQMRLLHYAATTTSPDQAGCANYLDRCARFRGRGSQIAAWIWKASSRYSPLKEFAHHPVPYEKLIWSKRLAREALLLLRHPLGPVESHIERTAPSWQKAGATFLRGFYEDLCSSTGFPGYFFSEHNANPFGRQDFLEAFVAANRGLYVCAVCDESGYRTTLDDNTYTDIEHYLPKSRYPHLACHPFNLIPICHLCNFTKGSADPLVRQSNMRCDLEDIFLPYREPGLGSRTYLQVTLGKTLTAAKLGRLKPQGVTDLRQRIEAFGNVYKVPKRWHSRVDEIGEKLFRRIRQFLQDGQGGLLNFSLPQTLLNALDQLLGYLHNEDQGKDPFAFAMTWWLVTLINQEVEPAIRKHSRLASQPSALLQEIISWSISDVQGNSARAEAAQAAQNGKRRGISRVHFASSRVKSKFLMKGFKKGTHSNKASSEVLVENIGYSM